MNRTSGYLIGAIVLIVIGVLLLLQNLGVIEGLEEVFWALAFVAAGVAFLANFATAPKLRWWSVIPGMVLLGIGLMIGLERYLSDLAGGLFLVMIAIAFWLIYITQREFWWAVIPAGFTFAGMAWVNVALTTMRQRLTPPELLGRVIAASRTLAWLGLPLGAALGGMIAGFVGVVAVYVGGSLLVIVIASFLLTTDLVRDPVMADPDDGVPGSMS